MPHYGVSVYPTGHGQSDLQRQVVEKIEASAPSSLTSPLPSVGATADVPLQLADGVLAGDRGVSSPPPAGVRRMRQSQFLANGIVGDGSLDSEVDDSVLPLNQPVMDVDDAEPPEPRRRAVSSAKSVLFVLVWVVVNIVDGDPWYLHGRLLVTTLVASPLCTWAVKALLKSS